MKDFKALIVWQKSHSITLDIYKLTATFPKHESFGLTSQIRRSALSIPSNIAEGCGRFSVKEFAQFLIIASGSSSELEYQLLLARDLDYISEIDYEPVQTKLIEIRKMLNSFIQKLNSNPKNI